MGTSNSIPSPRVPRWSAVAAAIGNAAISPERQSGEIWSAARQEWGNELIASIATIGRALAGIAEVASNPGTALEELDDWASENRLVGLVADLAPSALARSVATGAREKQVVPELFAEIADYYASRDLPGVVGATQKVPTSAATLELKDRLKDIARRAALTEGSLPPTADRWSDFIARIVARLATINS